MPDGVTAYQVPSSVVSTDTPNTDKEHKGTGPVKGPVLLVLFFENHHPTVTESLKGGNTLLMEIAVMYGITPDSWCTRKFGAYEIRTRDILLAKQVL